MYAVLKLSFFGGIGFGRVGDPLKVQRRVTIASRLDLLGTKLATVTQRIESASRANAPVRSRSGRSASCATRAGAGSCGRSSA